MNDEDRPPVTIDRRGFLAGAVALTAVRAHAGPIRQEGQEMYGLIGKMIAAAGQREALIAILLEGVAGMPGCLSYVVARDPADEQNIWITEVWDTKASHQASLSLPAVREAIAKAKPIIAGFGDSIVTTPVGGHGLQGPGR